MEPETPSRRTKAGDEPVTIDLEAVPAETSEETPAAEAKTDAEATETVEAASSEPEAVEEKQEPNEPAGTTYEEPARVETAPPARRS